VARLGEMLLQENLVTSAQLEEALEGQVVYGGRVGTNLVELGFLPEKELARVLGKQHQVPYAMGEMQPDRAALAVAPAAFFDDNDLIPMRIDATRITVAVADPKRIEGLDQLGFQAGRRVVPVVVPEFRLNQMLRKYCKAFRPMRPIDLNTLRPSKAKAVDGPKPAEAADLINEDDFARIYAQAAAGEEAEGEVATITGVALDEARPSSPQARIAEPINRVPSPPSGAEASLQPLTFAEAQSLLAKSADREDIARTVLRFAISKFKRALILSVQGDLLTGWHGAGQGVQQKAVRRIGVSLRENNTFKMVRDLRSHFVGSMKRGAGTAVFYKMLGGGFPTTAVMMPLLVRGKPVHLLYVDDGPDQFTPPDVGELLILSQKVAQSYEALITQRKARRG
jgi:Type II secretion system (T2SS), protein E, N-terminal domain